MPKPIAELRASGQVRLRTRDHTICLDSALSDRHRELRDELMLLAAEYEASVRGETPAPKGRLGSKPKVTKADVDAKAAELDEIADQMAEFEVVVTVSQAPAGEWNTWCAEHPPRENEPDEAGRRALVIRDAQHGSRCDFDALVEDLPGWVTALNGEQGTDEDWQWLAAHASPADLDDLADLVIAMHTGRVTVPKSLTSSLSTLLGGLDSQQPEPGESAPASSTDGNPNGKPSTSTTTTDD